MSRVLLEWHSDSGHEAVLRVASANPTAGTDSHAEAAQQRPCAVCGRPFPASRASARSCSSTCRSRAHRARDIRHEGERWASC